MRPQLQRGDHFGFCGGNGGLQPATAGLRDLSAQTAQCLEVINMHGQLVRRGWVLGGGIGKGPSLQGPRSGMQDIVDVGTGQGAIEGNVKGEIHGRIHGGGGCQGRRSMRPSQRGGGEVGMGARHAEGRGHPFPSMAGLAGEVGDFVHGGRKGGRGEEGREREERKGREEEEEGKKGKENKRGINKDVRMGSEIQTGSIKKKTSLIPGFNLGEQAVSVREKEEKRRDGDQMERAREPRLG